ncbi:MAG: type II secretion system F family protein [Planctomycetaceae bacterium]|jgi:type II secretory pathway component PulF|nr:type II secretion system F family protein [Planctomycetaceae bacterium]
MPVFLYKAVDVHGGSFAGTLSSNSPYEARAELRERGLRILSIAEQTTSRTKISISTTPGRYSKRFAGVMNELATLLSTGIPLLEAMRSVAHRQPRLIHVTIMQLCDRVSSGASLTEAMQEQPEMFDLLCISMTEIGENSGTLDATLRHWAEYKEKSLQFRDRVATALTYPIFVLLTGITVTIFLMTFVLPMLLESLIDSGKPLPLPTKIAKLMSDLFTQYGIELGIGFVLVIFVFVLLIRTERGGWLWNVFLLKLPMFGLLARKQAVSRIAFLIATLTKSGVPFLQALELTAKSSENRVIRKALFDAADAVRSGCDIAPAMQQTDVFPMSVIQIFSVGQESGRLDEMLDLLATDYDRQVSKTTERLAAIIEPVLILVLAVFVGFILFATILPILEAGNVL